MITVNSIINAVSVALNNEFGDNYTVYAEEIKQGLTEPCFFIFCINLGGRQMLSNSNSHFLASRYYRENRFCIQYFPLDENNGRTESNGVEERLFSCLEEITAEGDLLRGTDMSFEYTDRILSFFVNYNFFVYKTRESTLMGDLKRDIRKKS